MAGKCIRFFWIGSFRLIFSNRMNNPNCQLGLEIRRFGSSRTSPQPDIIAVNVNDNVHDQRKRSESRSTKNRSALSVDRERVKLNLTVVQTQKILTELNTRTLEQLTVTKNIGKNKAQALLKHRLEEGPLTSLHQLHGIKGFGKAFFSRLEESGELPPATKKFSRQLEMLNRLLPDDAKENISSIISIDIGLQNAAWVHMDRECRVLAWQQVHLTRPKPYNPAALKPEILNFVNTLPMADAHIVEMQSHRVGKHAAALLPFVIYLRITEAMLHCLLPAPCIPFDPHYTSKYFSLPSSHSQKKKAAVNLVESLFLEKKDHDPIEVECEKYLKEKSGLEGSKEIVKNLVGSSEELEKELGGSNDNPTVADSKKDSLTETSDTSPEIKLKISPELIKYFESCKKKDDLSDGLLQAIAFFNLMAESRK